MKIIAIALLLLPLSVSAQMKCSDGSYRDRCADGNGQEFESGGMSSYSAPQVHKRPISPGQGEQQRQQQSSSRQAASSGPKPPPSGLMSLAERARDMGISRNDLMRARSREKILMDMHRKDVEDILGSPTRVNQETIGGQLCHHLHWWEEYGWTHYIRLCNGRVDHIRQTNR